MRSTSASSRPPQDRSRLTRFSVRSSAAALLVAVSVSTAGCSGQSGANVAGPSTTTVGSPPASSVPATSLPAATTAHASPAAGRAAPMARSVPVRLQIPAIGVSSTLMKLGLKPDGTIEVPPKGFPAGWFTGAPTPGELGPAIIAGHVDFNGPGVFFRLHSLKSGDEVTITRQDGTKPVFRVTRVSKFPKDRFPTALVYGNIDRAGLRLITCGGTFDPATGHYEDNIVAFADLVAPRP